MSETFNLLGAEIAYDAHLYDDFIAAGSFQAYEYLNGNPDYRNDQKDKFLSGNIDNPVLDYPDLKDEWLQETEERLIAQKQSLLANEQDELIKRVYRWRLNEKIAEVRLLQSAKCGDMSRFRRYSEFVYGIPTEQVYIYTINTIRQKALEASESDDDNTAQAAQDLLAVLPSVDNDVNIKQPNSTVLENARSKIMNELGNLIALTDVEGELDAIQIKDAFSFALLELGDPDWKAVVDAETSRVSISVNQEEKTVKIPKTRKATASKVASLILHEIGTHVARRVNGERTCLKLLGIGLDRYEIGEEGLATIREQAYVGKFDDFAFPDRYLAISLALGLDGQERNFRQTYEVLNKYYTFDNLLSGKSPEDASQAASQSAWIRCVRTFRGTDCKTPGVVFTKDAIYRQGNIAVWDLINKDEEQTSQFNIGKYDPTNERHIWSLRQLAARSKLI